MPSTQDVLALLPNMWLLGADAVERARLIAERGSPMQLRALFDVLIGVSQKQQEWMGKIVLADPQFPAAFSSFAKSSSSRAADAEHESDADAAESMLTT
jgi:hypothetical protein